MTTIGSVSSNQASSATKDANALVGNYETFLTLLTTQLKNQSPLDPMDANQFTQQLVQYSAVEQQIKSNAQMENLVAMSTATNALNSLNFVGQTVTIDGSKGELTSGSTLEWKFNAPEAGTGAVVVRNEAGNIVHYEQNVALAKGDQKYQWNGKDAAGIRQPNGTYTIEFSAKDESGNTQTVTTDLTAKVDKVDLSTSEPMLILGEQIVKMSQVKSVAQATN